MSAKEKDHLWGKGRSGNPAGRPKGTGRPMSKLRRTQRKLHEMEDKALENIQKSVEGVDVDKEVLASSKWVIGAIVTVTKAATADEESRKPSEDSDETPSGPNVVPFTTSMN
jgi:hypothetical protein